jgi:hypothetical protein
MVLRRKAVFSVVALGAALTLAVGVTSIGRATHIRPKSATPIREALIPGHNPCGAPNRTHSAPLAFPSCNPPVNTSPYLTTGTPDNNTLPANMASLVKLDMILSPADMQLQAVLNDQYCKGTFAGPCTSTGEALRDFVGGLNVHFEFRITDHWNPSATDTATMIDIPIDWPVSCVAVGPGTPGGQCNALTGLNALIPGAVVSTRRMSWEVLQLYVQDGGSDGNAATTPNDTWMVRGLFQP